MPDRTLWRAARVLSKPEGPSGGLVGYSESLIGPSRELTGSSECLIRPSGVLLGSSQSLMGLLEGG